MSLSSFGYAYPPLYFGSTLRSPGSFWQRRTHSDFPMAGDSMLKLQKQRPRKVSLLGRSRKSNMKRRHKKRKLNFLHWRVSCQLFLFHTIIWTISFYQREVSSRQLLSRRNLLWPKPFELLKERWRWGAFCSSNKRFDKPALLADWSPFTYTHIMLYIGEQITTLDIEQRKYWNRKSFWEKWSRTDNSESPSFRSQQINKKLLAISLLRSTSLMAE